jgi:hypothetical protein
MFCSKVLWADKNVRFLHQHPDFGGVKPLRVTALRASPCLQQSPWQLPDSLLLLPVVHTDAFLACILKPISRVQFGDNFAGH